jgi:hypothetical protein
MGKRDRYRREQQTVIETHKLQYHLNCFGYYGFATGWAQASGLRWKNNEGYCGKCPFQATCWDAAKERVKKIFTESCREFDALVERHKAAKAHKPGILALKEWQAKYGGQSLDPYTTITLGYMEDGLMVAQTGKVDPRKAKSVVAPYPFEGNEFPDEYYTARVERVEGEEYDRVTVFKDWVLTDDPGKIIRTEAMVSYDEAKRPTDDPAGRG